MALCSSCEWFGKKEEGLYWCYHVQHNYSTSPDNKACNLYRSRW